LAKSHSILGAVLARQGKLDQAAVELREALRIQPDSPVARENLAAVLQQLGQSSSQGSENSGGAPPKH
jgi:Flp pilus assembly protein TadD